MKIQKPENKEKVWSSIKILAALWFLSTLIAIFFSLDSTVMPGNIAVIPIHGEIMVSDDGLGFGSSGTTSDSVVDLLAKADANDNIKAILLDINSPGGSGVAADEISQQIKASDKLCVAVVRDLGASAAYWIASSCDVIFVNRLSLTGSIGVIGSYLDFSGLIKEYNISYQRYVSGEYKDMGSPFKKPSEEEERLFQSLITKMRNVFVEEVAINRNMTYSKVDKLADGQIYLGSEAQKNGLADKIGTKQDAIRYIETKLNITAQPTEFRQKKSLTNLLYGFSSDKIGKFINSVPQIQLR